MRTPACSMVVAVSLALAGCGGGGDGGDHKRATEDEKPLAKPVYPRCGGEGFAPVRASHPGDGWVLTYVYPKGAPRPPRPDETTAISIVELGPDSSLGDTHGRLRTIAGHQVQWHDGGHGHAWRADWKTAAAGYRALSNGDHPQKLERMIRCLP